MQRIIANSKLIVKPTKEAEQKASEDLQIPDPSLSVAKATLAEALGIDKDEEEAN